MKRRLTYERSVERRSDCVHVLASIDGLNIHPKLPAQRGNVGLIEGQTANRDDAILNT